MVEHRIDEWQKNSLINFLIAAYRISALISMIVCAIINPVVYIVTKRGLAGFLVALMELCFITAAIFMGIGRK